MNNPLIITLVGMPGAGKSSLVEYLEKKGYPSVYFGGITLKEIKKRGLEITPDNEKIVREELRQTYGKEAYAKLISQEIDELLQSGQQKIIADGLYSWSEYKFFKNKYGEKIVIIAVAAARKTRHQRLSTRPERPLNEEAVTKREYAEIENIEKGGPIANADYTIVNDSDLPSLIEDLEKVLNKIDFS